MAGIISPGGGIRRRQDRRRGGRPGQCPALRRYPGWRGDWERPSSARKQSRLYRQAGREQWHRQDDNKGVNEYIWFTVRRSRMCQLAAVFWGRYLDYYLYLVHLHPNCSWQKILLMKERMHVFIIDVTNQVWLRSYQYCYNLWTLVVYKFTSTSTYS